MRSHFDSTHVYARIATLLVPVEFWEQGPVLVSILLVTLFKRVTLKMIFSVTNSNCIVFLTFLLYGICHICMDYCFHCDG